MGSQYIPAQMPGTVIPSGIAQLQNAPAAMAPTSPYGVPGMTAPDSFSSMAGAGGAPGAAASQAEGLLPGSPQDMLLGAAVGTGAGLGLTHLANKGAFDRMAATIDKLPGVRQVSQAMENRLVNIKRPGLREFFMRDAMTPGGSAAKFSAEMQRRQMNMMANGLPKQPQVQQILRNNKYKTFEQAQVAMQKQITALEGKAGKLSSQDYKLLKSYRGANQALKGLNDISYKPLLEQQATQAARLSAQGVGPIGRSVASLGLYTQRIFGGDTMRNMMGAGTKVAEEAGGKLLSVNRIMPAALGGAFVFGSAISKARKADDGDKLPTFMHDFLGYGIGTMVGWEVGQKILTAVGFRGLMDKVGNKIGLGNVSNRLLTPGRGILEKFMSPATVSKVTKFLPKLTFGGVATGLLGGLLFGWIFQKIGEGVSDSIFGKPKSVEKEEQAKAQEKAQAAMQAQMMATGQMPAGGQMPMALPAAQMASAMPTSPNVFSQFQGSLPSATAAAPAFSLTPQQISQSSAAAQDQLATRQLQQQFGA